MVEIIEQTPDVELHNPVTAPAAASGDGVRLQRRLSRPITQGAAGIDAETIERFETKLGDNPRLPYQGLGNVIGLAGHAGFLPVARLFLHACWMMPPLRSSAITAASTLLRAAPSLGGASLLSASPLGLVPFAYH